MKTSPLVSVSTVGMFITSLTMLSSKGSLIPSLYNVSLTAVPFLPRISLTAESPFSVFVTVSSILRILSPGFTPALYAGVPLTGATTVKTPSFIPTSIPTPSICPLICSPKLFASTGGKKTVYGSLSEETMPLIAP